jgi:DNA mismatch repair protein MutH
LRTVAGFAFDELDASSIVAHARRLEGMTVRDVAIKVGRGDLAIAKGKGSIGQVLQTWFAVPFSDNRPQADLPDARVPRSDAVGIEIKIVPMRQSSKRDVLRAKERNVISMINYSSLQAERWSTASVRHKLEHILFIFYLYDYEDWRRSSVLKSVLWSLRDEPLSKRIEKDWSHTRDLVAAGHASLLTESDKETVILRTCRKGAGGSREQKISIPGSTEPAWKRAFSIAPGHLDLVLARNQQSVPLVSFLPDVAASTISFEGAVLTRLRTLVGRRLRDLDPSKDWSKSHKNAAALVVKRALRLELDPDQIVDFVERRVLIRVLPVLNKSQKLKEAVSFPVMRLREFADEEWEESSLLSFLQLILFIPTFLANNKTRQADRRIGDSWFWSPSERELGEIQSEWTAYQNQVRSGACKTKKDPRGRAISGLLKESQTTYIHMRPHGRDSEDLDEDRLGNRIVKQSFWLNKRFLEQLMEGARGIRS